MGARGCGHMGRGSSCLQWTHGVGVPVAYSGYMTAGGPAAYMYMGQGSSRLQWVHGGRGPAAYRGYMWAGDPAAHSGYMRAGGSSGCVG